MRLLSSLATFGAILILLGCSRKRDEPSTSTSPEKPPEVVKPEPKREPPGREIVNSLGMQFILIPAGRFLMGSPPGELGRNENELQREVEISQPYYLGVHEVTQEQYEKVLSDNPAAFSKEGASKAKVQGMDTKRFPVEYVSWHEAVKFCSRLTARGEEKRAGRSYRLPTEAEWERACRGGEQRSTPFSVGDELRSDAANFKARQEESPLERPTIVGTYPANAYGLFDMHGNVWEWCQDSNGDRRVLRGGSWLSRPSSCRSATRYVVAPEQRTDEVGFRVVCTVAP